MRVDELSPAPGSTKAKKRVGRGIGGKGGKTAGAGTKGQKSRGRGKVARGFEGGQMPLKQRVPKLKGFNNPFRVEYSPVNLDQLTNLNEAVVTPEVLVAAGLVRRGVGQLVMAGGETSGACVQALGVRSLRIGAQIDPGVPWCHAVTGNGQPLHLVLKSGNFGTTDFFDKAFEVQR